MLHRRMLLRRCENKNLFDASKITTESYLKNSGETGMSPGGFVSDYMEYLAGKTYYLKANIKWRYCWYDSEKNYLGFSNWDGDFDRELVAPAKAYYLRVAIYDESVGDTIYKRIN